MTMNESRLPIERMLAALFVFVLLNSANTLSQTTPAPVDQQEQALVVDSIATILNNNYVYPETAAQMGKLIRQNLKESRYESLTDPNEFADKLTEDLQSVSHDRHLWVRYGPRMIAMMKNAKESPNDNELQKLELQENREANYGFKELKLLEGNMVYLKLDNFMSTTTYPEAGQAAIAAMQFAANARVLIIDLRDNGGGSPDMIQLLSSYFFKGDIQHLNTFYWRPKDETVQFWTLPHVPGQKIEKTDIYVLTSSNTFSAAEEFTYNLKNMKRAVIVGETTGGGAHPTDARIINDHFGMSVPMGKAINPITKTNWEGTGIKPHYEVPRDKALDKAIIVALDSLLKKETDEERIKKYTWIKERKNTLLEPFALDEKILKKYVGKFGPRMIIFENAALYYQREGRPKMKMIPMNADTFIFEEIPYFKLRVVEDHGKVVSVMGIYDDGHTDENKKEG
jgi:hypothetical protein